MLHFKGDWNIIGIQNNCVELCTDLLYPFSVAYETSMANLMRILGTRHYFLILAFFIHTENLLVIEPKLFQKTMVPKVIDFSKNTFQNRQDKIKQPDIAIEFFIVWFNNWEQQGQGCVWSRSSYIYKTGIPGFKKTCLMN